MSVEVISDDPDVGIYNIIADQGKTLRRVFTWTDNDGNPINLTGASGTMKVRKFYPRTFLQAAYWDAAVLSLSSPSSGITFDAANGIIYMTATAAEMAAITVGIYQWDLEITLGSGDVHGVLKGDFEVRWETSF